MDLVQYEQESSMVDMDTTPITHSLPTEIVPTFLPTLPSSIPDLAHTLIPSENGMSFMLDTSKPEISTISVAPSMHLSMPPEMSMSVYLNSPMDAMEPPAMLLPVPTNFMPDMRATVDPFGLMTSGEKVDFSPDARTLSVSPPQSQVPSPGLPYGAGVSPLESVLDSNGVAGGHSRANASLSPPSFTSLSPPSLQGHPVDYSSNASNGSLDETGSQPRAVIGQMLKDIAKTAMDAGDAFEHCRGVQQTTKVGELRDRIAQVLNMLAHMSMTDGDLAPVVPSLAPTLSEMQPNVVAQMDSALVDPLHLAVSDQSRKRCASELEEHRTVKALKREPQDDAPLSIIASDTLLHSIAPPTTFASQTPVTLPLMQPFGAGPASRPPSRPPTPPSTFSSRNSFSSMKTPVSSTFPQFANAAHSHSSVPPLLSGSATTSTFPSLQHSSWSDPVIPTTSRHHHSLSAGSAAGSLLGLPALPTNGSNSTITPNALQNGLPQPPIVPSNASAISPPTGRMSRSGSISGAPLKNPYSTLSYTDAHPEWKGKKTTRQSNWYISSDPVHPSSKSSSNNHSSSAPTTAHNSPSDDEDDDEDSDSEGSISGKTVTNQASTDRSSTSSAADLPAEYRADVDRVFFDFLNKLCSNLDATCSKGEQIHQTLMAKKMQRLDESPDFRPFKFRILAFTNAFMEELARQGYPEEKIPMKKVRNYLWRQQYILRFNEDGKKAKSKGNHIWNVEAKKAGDGQWEFRPFHRKLAGTPPAIAYAGLRWSWKPHVWDPQVSFKKTPVAYSSPTLPPWLSWRDGELFGTPPADAENCQVVAIAKFMIDGQETQLSHTFNLSIAPASALDGPAYSRSRRPSLAGEPPKRSASDSALFQAPQRSSRATRMDDSRVIRVLQSVAQRVTDEAESQFVSASPPKQGELQDLVKQKHVLEQTVDAYDKAISGHGHLQSRRLAVAAQHVVLQAAQTVVADRTVATGGMPTPQVGTTAIQSVSMTELTDKTQDAIAMAVKMNGTASNEVDIIVTATSILKAQTPMLDTPAGILPTTTPRIASTFPPPTNLSTLPEHV